MSSPETSIADTHQISPFRQIASQIIGYGIAFEPAQIVTTLENLTLLQMPDKVADFVANEFIKQRESRGLLPLPQFMATYGSVFLCEALDDVVKIFEFAVSDCGLSVSAIEDITTRAETIHTVAHIAMRSSQEATRLINEPGAYEFMPDIPAIQLLDKTPPSRGRHCPEAGVNSQVMPSPLFTRFVGWAGSLYAHTAQDQL